MVIVWRVTESCNLSCAFCGYARDLPRRRRNADPQAIRNFGALLAEYQRATDDPVLVSWLGGEPLLWQPLKDLTRLFHSKYGLRVSTTTNGTSLGSAEMRAHLLEHYAEVTVSVDAVGSLHDDLRGWAGGFDRLERYVTALSREKRLANRGPKLKANVVLMRETLAGFEQLCIRLAAWGIEEITYNQLGGNDRPEFYPAHRLTPEQADWLVAELPRLRERLEGFGVRLRGTDAYARRIQATACGALLPIENCHPGQTFLFIDEKGRVAPCSFSALDYGIPMQEVSSVRALRELPLRFSDMRGQRRLLACQDCHSTQVFEKFNA